jgi:HSP20 family protein
MQEKGGRIMLGLATRRKSEARPRLFYSPFREMEDLVSRMMGEFFEESGIEKQISRRVPSFNMCRDNGNLIIEASVPGFEKKDMTVELREDILTIKGKRKEEKDEEGRDYYNREFQMGSFQRSLNLPGKVNPQDLKCKYNNGILEIKFPSAEVPPKSVSIRVE